MEQIKVDVQSLYEHHPSGVYASNAEVQLAIDVANGLIQFIRENKWKNGYRNNMAVDFELSMYTLGYIEQQDRNNMFVELFKDDLSQQDMNDYQERSNRIDDYLERWHNDGSYEYYCIPHFFKSNSLNIPKKTRLFVEVE